MVVCPRSTTNYYFISFNTYHFSFYLSVIYFILWGLFILFSEFIKSFLVHKNVTFFSIPAFLFQIDRSNDEELVKLRRLRDRVPFAIVGANTLITNNAGVRVRARSYPWGIVEVENMDHNDFAAIRYLLLSVYMQVGFKKDFQKFLGVWYT